MRTTLENTGQYVDMTDQPNVISSELQSGQINIKRLYRDESDVSQIHRRPQIKILYLIIFFTEAFYYVFQTLNANWTKTFSHCLTVSQAHCRFLTQERFTGGQARWKT